MLRTFATLLILSGCGPVAEDSGGPVPDRAEPMLTLSEGLVDFETVELADAPLFQLVELQNTGDATLHLGQLSFEEPDAPFALTILGDTVLEPSQWSTLEITLLPQSLGELHGTALIESDDPFGPRSLLIRANAQGGALSLDAEAEDLGAVPVGCSVSTELRIVNSGNAELIISSVALDGEGEAFSLAQPELPASLAPQGYLDLSLDYSPAEEGEHAATVSVTSDDPVQPQASVSYSAQASIDTWTDQSFHAPLGGVKADLIIAVDESAGMDEALARFLASFADFFEALLELDADVRIALTRADDGCIRGSEIWIDGSSTTTQAQNNIETMLDLGGSYASNSERAFMLMEAALSEAGTGGCNEGLLRLDAGLHLMGISNEAEQSVAPWSHYFDLFQDHTANEVVFHAIGGPLPDGCEDAAAYEGMADAVAATGGWFLSICEPDWGPALAELAAVHLADRRSFRLDSPALDDTISVRIDAVTTEAWRYESASQSVILEDSVELFGGEEIEIRYAAQPVCL